MFDLPLFWFQEELPAEAEPFPVLLQQSFIDRVTSGQGDAVVGVKVFCVFCHHKIAPSKR